MKQPFGGSQSPDDARIAAIAKAKREALERAGIYVESLLVVKNAIVEKDEILALTAGVLQAEVVSQKSYLTGDAFGIEVIVKVVVDTAVLEERVKKLLQDRPHLKQLQEAQKREKDLLQKLAKLEEENQSLTKQGQSTKKLEKPFRDVSQGLTAVGWFYKASSLWDGEKITDPMKAIEYLNNAINLEKDYAEAYGNRGIAYGDLGQYQRAIEDHNQAIRLKPDDALAYNNRGIAYAKLGQHQRAIEDYNQAIRLKPDDALAYISRGAAYGDLGQYQRAIEDYNESIRLKPDYAMAYYNRGYAYSVLGQYQRAIEDYNQAIRLKPDYALAYHNRGLSYYDLGEYRRAIEDNNQAIRLKPDYAEAYNNRGLIYILLGNQNLGCLDLRRACELGCCKGIELAKNTGHCR